ncbi:MAG: ribosomal L7Ae/L30e/S12e/Gadd45 family protein [Clostridia bacterium]|nr:ribosomal L7Ae/L30e/S12e/Gadd45 family protein [Clostridia bacterium]
MLGLAKRAGRLAVGFDAAIKAAKAHKATLAVCAKDISEKTKKEWQFQVPSISLLPLSLDKTELGCAIGVKKPVGILCICDQGFADAIQKLNPEIKEESL